MVSTFEVPLISVHALLLERDDMDAGVVQQLRTALAETPAQYKALRESVEKLEANLASGKGDTARTRLKLGIACYLLGRAEKAAESFSHCKGALASFYQALALTELGRFQAALDSLDAAAKSGYAASEIDLQRAAALRGLGRLDQALKTLEGLDKYVRSSAEFLFQFGAVKSAQGDTVSAIAYFEKAIEVDPRHAGALFQLAYHSDRNGNDTEAITLYERCLRVPPPRLGTLMNLGILYEDTEQYDKAAHCYDQVVRCFPNHPRAKLFLRDASASRSQFYDEEAERSYDRYNAVLDIPITDFELSVRSRNCLKKINIRTLGDLTRCTEQQLLSSKNFGETSLQEIKNLLAMKGLRLGQALEQAPRKPMPIFNLEDYSPEEQALLTKPVSELGFSVRARKCMSKLGISNVGELIAHSGDDLLECKNFGVTSLVEVREKLKALGLALRGDST
jgi:DNA-directed RNA polymerase subunit alpha